MKHKKIELPLAVDAYGTDGFSDLLVAELLAQKYSLPLHLFGNNGEWPDDNTLELSYVSSKQENEKVSVLVNAEFDLIVCSACFGADKQKMKELVKVSLDLKSAEAEVAPLWV